MNAITQKLLGKFTVVDVVDKNETHTNYASQCLVVDKTNIDSLLGAALWISRLDFMSNVEVHYFNPVEKVPPVTVNYDQVVVFGCPIDLEVYRGRHHTQVFAYRGMYEDIPDSSSLKIVRPCDEWFGSEQALIDNSVSAMVNSFMAEKGNKSELYVLTSMVPKVALHVNHGHNGMDSIEDQFSVHNLRETLERIFVKRSTHIKDDVRSLCMRKDHEGFKSHLDVIKEKAYLGTQEIMLKIPGERFFSMSKYYKITVVDVDPGISRDVLKFLYPIKGPTLTVEHMGRNKIVRIKTNDRSLTHQFMASLHPIKTWYEGEILTGIVFE